MSFSSSVKAELCAVSGLSRAQERAECYGLLLFGRRLSFERIALVTENQATAERYRRIVKSVTGNETAIEHNGRFFTVSLPEAEQRKSIMEAFGHSEQDLTLRVNRAVLDDENCYGAFLRGAFLSGGTVADPEKEYHLEICVPFHNLANDLHLFLLNECGIPARLTARKGGYLIYLKESEQIEDFLTLTGAVRSSLSLMDIKIYKDMRNRVNRAFNCENANLDKTINAASNQVRDIRLIAAKRGLESLPEELQELAVLRLENTDLTLRELGEKMSVPLSRSGINHRFRRIAEIAQELRSGLPEGGKE